MTIRVTHGGNMFEHSKASAPKRIVCKMVTKWLKMDPSANATYSVRGGEILTGVSQTGKQHEPKRLVKASERECGELDCGRGDHRA